MQVLIRADSGYHIGTGHVMRCLVLAEELQNRGVRVFFASRSHQGHISTLIQDRGFDVIDLGEGVTQMLPESEAGLKHESWLGVSQKKDADQLRKNISAFGKFDCLVVDHYSLDQEWENQVSNLFKKIMAIDDLADRSHSVDLLLDQNDVYQEAKRYKPFVGPDTKLLMGPSYALLREEFYNLRKKKPRNRRGLSRGLIFLGGVDITGETLKIIEAVSAPGNLPIHWEVVIGSSNPREREIKKKISELPRMTLHVQIENMAELMERSDISIGACGVSSWERCCAGLPALVMSLADNQVRTSNILEKEGVVRHLGLPNEVSQELIKSELIRLAEDLNLLKEMEQSARKMVDGLGALRVADELMGL